MKLRAVLFGILAVSLAAIFALVAPTGDVRADDNEAVCTAYINVDNDSSVPVSACKTPGKALEVDKDSYLTVRVDTPAPITSHKVQLALTDVLPWTVSDETDDGTATYYEEQFSVEEYAKHGLGLYKVTAMATLEDGDTCSATAYIKIIGGSWLGTTLGRLALVLMIGFSLILLLILLYLFAGMDLPWFFCGPVLPIAVALTTLAMVRGGTGIPSSGDSQTTGAGYNPQVSSSGQDTFGNNQKFRLRILIPAIVSALLSAIGFLLTLQQAGVAYPTITIVVLSLVLALIAGILLPLLAIIFSPWR